jgi:hypothetical protein
VIDVTDFSCLVFGTQIPGERSSCEKRLPELVVPALFLALIRPLDLTMCCVEHRTVRSSRSLFIIGSVDYCLKAIEDYEEELQLDPRSFSHMILGSIFATCADDNIRDGKRALKYATKGCEQENWKGYYRLGVLASAYAEVGKIKRAIEFSQKAIDLASIVGGGFPNTTFADSESRRRNLAP